MSRNFRLEDSSVPTCREQNIILDNGDDVCIISKEEHLLFIVLSIKSKCIVSFFSVRLRVCMAVTYISLLYFFYKGVEMWCRQAFCVTAETPNCLPHDNPQNKWLKTSFMVQH